MAGDRNVKMVFEMDVKGVDSLKRAVASIKEAEKASKGLESQTRATTSATKEKMSFWDRVVNRIAQGIPTMFSLVAAYKALQLAINLVKASLKDMDNELQQQQEFGRMISLFNQFTGASGVAVGAAQNFAKSMNVAAAATVYFQEVSKGTVAVWEDLMKAANTFGSQALGKGIPVEEVLRLASAFGTAATSVEDLQHKAQQMLALLKRPSSRNELLVSIGFSKADIAEVNKGGTTIKEVFEKILVVQERLAEGMKDKEKTFTSIFRAIKEASLDAFANGIGLHAEGLKEKFLEIGPKIVAVVGLMAGEIKRFFAMAKPLFQTLGMVLLALATTFDIVAAAVAAVSAGLLMGGMVITRFVGLLVSLGAEGARALGFGGIADGIDKAAAAVEKFAKWEEKAADTAADYAVAAVARMKERADAVENLIAGKSLVSFTPDPAKAAAALANASGKAMAGSTVVNQTANPVDNAELTKTLKLLDEINAALERKAATSELQKRLVVLMQWNNELEKMGKLFSSGAISDTKRIVQYSNAVHNLGLGFEDFFHDSDLAALKLNNTIEELGDAIIKDLSGKELTPFEHAIEEINRKTKAYINTLEEAKKAIPGSLANKVAEDAAIAAAEKKIALAKQLTAANIASMIAIDAARKKLFSGKDSGADYIQLQIKQAIAYGLPALDRVREITQGIVEHANSAAMGIKLGVVAFLDSIDTEAKAAYNAVTETLGALKQGFSDGLLAILTGNKDDIENAMKNLMSSLARILTDYLTESILAGLKNGLGDMDGFLSGLFGGKGGKKIPIVDEAGSPLLDSGGQAINTEASDSWMKTNGLKIAATAAGVISLANAAKNGTLTPLSGAFSGALMGASLGSVVPVIGTVIGAIVGAIVGAVAGVFSQSAAKEDRNVLHFTFGPGGVANVGAFAPWGGSKLTEQEVATIRTAIQKKVDELQAGWIDLMLAIPKKIFDTVLGLIPSMSDMKFTDTDNFTDVTGSNKFKDDETRKTLVVGTDNINKWVDIFVKQELPQAMFEAYKPIITKVFESLGFDEQKVNQLMARWKNLGEGVAKEILAITIAVSTLNEVTKHRNFNQDFKDATADANASYTDQMKDGQFDNIKTLVALMNSGTVSMTNQVDLIGRIATEAEAMYQNQLAFVQKIAQTYAAIHESIQDQIFAIKLDRTGDDKNARKNLLLDQLNVLDVMLQKANSPEQIAAIEARMQNMIGQIYQIDPAAYSQWAEESLNKLDAFALERLTQLGTEAETYWNAQMKPIIDSLNAFKDVLDSMTGDGTVEYDENGNPRDSGPRPPNPKFPTDDLEISFDDMSYSAKNATSALEDFAVALNEFSVPSMNSTGPPPPEAGPRPVSRRPDARGRTDTFDTGVR